MAKRPLGRSESKSSSLALIAPTAIAEEAILSTFLEPNHIITQQMHLAWADDLKEATNGEVSFEVLVGGSLMPAQSHMRGAADGLAQAVIHGAPYTPSTLPVSNALGDMGFRKADAFVLAYAYTDFMMHEAVGYDEWRRNGVIFGAGFANPTYRFLCREDLRSLEDLRGKRVRTNGGGWARFAQSIGMVPVNLPSSEIYMGMDRGALDCASADPTHLTTGATILDITKSVVMVPLSPAYNSPGLIFNVDWWQSLSSEQRRTVFNQNARAMARLQITLDSEVERNIEQARTNGISINEPDAALNSALDFWVADGVGGMADVARDAYGIEDPDALFDLFQTYIDKWAKLMEGVNRKEEDALTELLKANLFDTLDPETYGMD